MNTKYSHCVCSMYLYINMIIFNTNPFHRILIIKKKIMKLLFSHKIKSRPIPPPSTHNFFPLTRSTQNQTPAASHTYWVLENIHQLISHFHSARHYSFMIPLRVFLIKIMVFFRTEKLPSFRLIFFPLQLWNISINDSVCSVLDRTMIQNCVWMCMASRLSDLF